MTARWREREYLERLNKPRGNAIGNILEQEPSEAGESKPKAKKAPPRKEAKQLTQMKIWLKAAGINFESEYQFAKPRKFRADIAIPELMTIAEFDGIFSQKSRHTTVTGFSKDCEKTNLAAVLGWKVLRYTGLNYHHLLSDVQEIQNSIQKAKQ